MTRNFETMAEMYIRLKCEARWMGLAINVSKTKSMIGRGLSVGKTTVQNSIMPEVAGFESRSV